MTGSPLRTAQRLAKLGASLGMPQNYQRHIIKYLPEATIIHLGYEGGYKSALPALMIAGMPADIANATNRVGVFLQCLVGVRGFKKHNMLDANDIIPVLVPTLIGSLS